MPFNTLLQLLKLQGCQNTQYFFGRSGTARSGEWAGRECLKTPDGIQNLQTRLSAMRRFHTDCHHAQWHLKQLLTQHRFPCKSSELFQADLFHISRTSAGYFLWDFIKSKVDEIRPASTDDLKQ
jgi:hypothetical protein